jgi:hypothetical protein
MNSMIRKIDPLYVNQRRAMALAGSGAFQRSFENIPAISRKSRLYAEVVATAELIQGWIMRAGESINSFESLWTKGDILPGMFFLTTRHFWFKGVRKQDSSERPLGYTKYEQLGKQGCDLTLKLLMNRDHVAPGSPGSLLSGKVGNLTVLAAVEKTERDIVLAVPIIIGRLVEDGPFTIEIPIDNSEIRVENTDTFDKIRPIRRPSKEQFSVLREIPESIVKISFAEILEEEEVPKDWGGERSDLFTSLLRVKGERRTAAFLFKGPSDGRLFRPMEIAHLGKRGDQIERLASEPADVLVVQHCHSISAPVRSMLRAFANQVGNQRKYCLVDGADTYRILKACSKI